MELEIIVGTVIAALIAALTRLTWVKDNCIAKELYAPFIFEKDIKKTDVVYSIKYGS